MLTSMDCLWMYIEFLIQQYFFILYNERDLCQYFVKNELILYLKEPNYFPWMGLFNVLNYILNLIPIETANQLYTVVNKYGEETFKLLGGFKATFKTDLEYQLLSYYQLNYVDTQGQYQAIGQGMILFLIMLWKCLMNIKIHIGL